MPVNYTTEKNEQTFSNLSQNAGAGVVAINVLQAVQDPDAATEIKTGSHCRWLYIEFNVSAETLTNTKIFHWQLVHIPFGLVSTGDPTLYDQVYKAMILKRGMEMLVKDNQSLVKRIFTIKGKMIRRFKDGDIIQFQYKCSSTETINVCGIFISKTYI